MNFAVPVRAGAVFRALGGREMAVASTDRLSKTVGGNAALGRFLNIKPTQMANPK
jgi:hypothetical protein